MLKKTMLGVALVSLLSGCVSTEKQVCPPTAKVNIPHAENGSVKSGNTKVIVLPVDMEFDDSAADRLKTAMRKEIENQVHSVGSEVVDRKLADKLTEEIKLAEASGKFNSKGVPIADYAIITEVISNDFERNFTEAHEATNLLTGKAMWVAASCSFKSQVDAVIKVVALPEMNVVERIEITGDELKSSDMQNSRCPISQSEYVSMVTTSAKEAIDYSKTLREVLAPTAVAMELRQCESGSMVKVSMGKDKNVKASLPVEFISVMKSGEELESFTYGEGEVINSKGGHGITQKYSWVVVDEEVALKVQEGDKVKLLPPQCDLLDVECHTGGTGVNDILNLNF